jgi:pantetheine-phosphate adenylyltransferase
MDKRIAVFPGSFDPITNGHVDILKRGLPLFEEIIVGIGDNTSKKYFFSVDQRETFIKKVFGSESRIKVMRYGGLTVDFCKQQNANFILRGLRTSADFEFERAIAQNNRAMSGIETVFIVAAPELSHISSTIVRDILNFKGDASKFVPNIL